ncbi:MAG: hypothetical protein MUF84_09680 [Anaerolineae bacterium]|nr:hypothetical protein [Anaerolineae bacterium]
MLSLSDPAGRLYKANYTDGSHVASLLQRAESGEPIDTWYEDLFQELCHQCGRSSPIVTSGVARPLAPGSLARIR